ncbi:unnamed protein product, partial [Amoebophrya sp. A25]
DRSRPSLCSVASEVVEVAPAERRIVLLPSGASTEPFQASSSVGGDHSGLSASA